MLKRFLGIALIVLALGIGIVPHFTDCLSQGAVTTLANGKTQPMKCHWSAQAEIAVALPLVGVGAMLTTSKRKGTIMSLSVIGVILGAVAIALPDTLIGTCATPTHICNTAMKPTLNILGSLAIAGSLGMLLTTRSMID
jgi:hypothetical protein